MTESVSIPAGGRSPRLALGMFLLGATLAFGLIAAAGAIAKAFVASRSESGIRVKGFAATDLESDLATWSARITARATTLPEAYARLEQSAARLQAFVGSAGFPDSTWVLSAVSTGEVKRRDKDGNLTNEIEAYELSQKLSVRSERVWEVYDLSRNATSLIREGIDIKSFDPDYVSTQIEAVKLALLEQATANARERAETLARGSGGAVGELLSASQGVFQIVPRNSTSVSDYGSYDTSTIAKTVKAVVTLDFTVKGG
jgi:hypothetical protein